MPVPNKNAKTIAKAFVDHCILQYGPVNVLKSDLGTEYINSVLSSLTNLLNINHKTSTAYHHESLGSVERSHRTLNEYLRNYCGDNSSWTDLVKYFAFCYNSTPNTAINMYTPFELVFGKMPPALIEKGNQIPSSSLDQYVIELKSNLKNAHKAAEKFLLQNKLINKANSDTNCNPIIVNVGDKVLLVDENRNKRDPYYKLGYEVIEILDNYNVRLKDVNSKELVVHRNRLRIY